MNILKMQPASPSGTAMRHESLPAHTIQWKRPGGRETLQTQSWRGQRCYQGHFVWLPSSQSGWLPGSQVTYEAARQKHE